MRILGALGVVALVFALPAHGDVTPQLTQPLIDTLTPIDSLPSIQQINKVFDDNPSMALANLQAIANPATFVDRGVQIRAIRALVHYCATSPCGMNDPVRTTLTGVASRYSTARSGSDLLVLRAALESIGLLQVPADYVLLQDQLQHPSRDIRAAAARALRDLGNTAAIPALRARYNIEPANDSGSQVRLAISDALRVLGQPL